MISIAICDDDNEYIHNTFEHTISNVCNNIDVSIRVYCYNNGNELINDFRDCIRFDIVILDIDMPEINGKETAEKLRLIDTNFFLVFITSYETEVMNTIPYRINAFIPKDSSHEYYTSELTRVIKEYERHKPDYEVFQISRNGAKQIVKLVLNDILYFYCIKKAVFMVIENAEINIYGKITDIINKYVDKDFFEICRGYVVNIAKVKTVRKNEVVLDNGKKLPLSRGRDKLLLDRLVKYIYSRM